MWTELNSLDQLERIPEESKSKPVVIFKHSTRCSISAMAENRLNRATPPDGVTFYHLDLIRYRNLSNRIAELFSVHHESPQVLVIRDGSCVYDESHGGIDMSEIAEAVK